MKKPGYHTRSLNWQRRQKISEQALEAQARIQTRTLLISEAVAFD